MNISFRLRTSAFAAESRIRHILCIETRRTVLPPSLPPRGLSRVAAAAYVGVGATLFSRGVAEGLLPKPFRLYGRVLWCRLALDAAIDVLRDAETEAEATHASDSWADYQ